MKALTEWETEFGAGTIEFEITPEPNIMIMCTNKKLPLTKDYVKSRNNIIKYINIC